MTRVLAALLLAVVAVACAPDVGAEPDRTIRPRATPRPTPDTSWVPNGYRVAADGVALKSISGECTHWDCVAYDVVTRDGCPNGLYVEANVLDSGGRVIGFTNDSVGQLRAGDRAKVILDVIEEDGEGIRVTEVSCY